MGKKRKVFLVCLVGFKHNRSYLATGVADVKMQRWKKMEAAKVDCLSLDTDTRLKDSKCKDIRM